MSKIIQEKTDRLLHPEDIVFLKFVTYCKKQLEIHSEAVSKDARAICRFRGKLIGIYTSMNLLLYRINLDGFRNLSRDHDVQFIDQLGVLIIFHIIIEPFLCMKNYRRIKEIWWHFCIKQRGELQ